VLSMFAASVDLGFAFGPIIFGWLSFIFGVRFSYIPLALILFFSSSFLMCVGRNVLFEKSSGRLTSNSNVESDKPLIKEINRVA